MTFLANTANGKEGLKHASTLRYIQNTGQGQRGEDMLRPRKAMVGCDNVCCSSLVLSITAGSRRFPAVNSQSIYVPFGLVNSKNKRN